MATYDLRILTPAGQAYAGQVESLRATGSDGDFGVLANHAPLIAAIAPGPATVRDREGTHHFAITGGVLEIGSEEGVLFLADDAEPAPDRQAATARAHELVALRES